MVDLGKLISKDSNFRSVWEEVYPGLYEAVASGDVARVASSMPTPADGLDGGNTILLLLCLISTSLKTTGARALVHWLCEQSRELTPLTSTLSNNFHVDVCDVLLNHGLEANSESGLFDLFVNILLDMTSPVQFGSLTENQSSMAELLLYTGLRSKSWDDLIPKVSPVPWGRGPRGLCYYETMYETSEGWEKHHFSYFYAAKALQPFQDYVNRSQVLCLFKLFYHKFILLNFESIFHLTQTLLFEGMYAWEYMMRDAEPKN